MKNKLNNSINKHVNLLLVLILASIGTVYFIHSLQFGGPAYLSDEVNYLAKAAVIGGNSLDAASGMYFGYSVFISPAYLITDNPEISWRVVQFVNTLLIVTSLLLSFSDCKKSIP
jgi:hypothetical protein